MILQTKGQISLVDIGQEYKDAQPHLLSEFSEHVEKAPGDTIAISEFYGKSAKTILLQDTTTRLFFTCNDQCFANHNAKRDEHDANRNAKCDEHNANHNAKYNASNHCHATSTQPDGCIFISTFGHIWTFTNIVH